MNEPTLFERITWPEDPTIESLAEPIARMAGFDSITIEPIPESVSLPELSGMAVPVGRTVKVYYDPGLSPINRGQTILHEYAHILLGDVHVTRSCTQRRTTFDDPREQRAELLGMRLLLEINRRRNHQSAVMNFITGGTDAT